MKGNLCLCLITCMNGVPTNITENGFSLHKPPAFSR